MPMPSFDLLTEPWIPVRDAGADLRESPDAPASFREVGLREALLHAHEILEVYTDSPLETIALNRLLLALALDVYQRRPDVDEWVAFWKAGRFPAAPLDEYLVEWGDRFDLLHPEYPFFQTSRLSARDPAVVSNLFHHLASGNNGTLFSHAIDSSPISFSLNTLARGIVSVQAFGFSGLAGAAAAGGRLPNFSQGPLVGRAQFWIRGRSLFEALLLNGPPDESARMGATSDDAPVWRSKMSEAPKARRHTGLLDMLTWPSRYITLANQENEEMVSLEGVYLSPADKLDPQPTDDPLSAHVASKEKGLFPLGFRADRALWRDASVLFRVADPGAAGAPETFRWISNLASWAAPSEASELRRIFREEGVDAFGIATEKGKAGKAEIWRHERLPLYVEILRNETRQVLIARALDIAQKGASELWSATFWCAMYQLLPPPPGDQDNPEKREEKMRERERKLPKNKKTKENDVTRLVREIGTEPRYWAALEPCFFDFLGRLADADEEDTRTAALVRWQKDVFEAATRAFDAATASFDGDARHLRATAEGRARLKPVSPFSDAPQAPSRPEPDPEPDPSPQLSIFA